MTDPTSSEVSQEDKTMALLAYILGIFTSFIGPLVLFIIKKDQSKFVAYHALQALILVAAAFVIEVVVGVVPILGALVDVAIWAVTVVTLIIAALAANRGEWYSLPVIGDFTRKQLNIS